MTYYLKSGSTYRVTKEDNLVVSKILPPGNYVVGYDARMEFYYLDRTKDFVIPEKLYGDIVKTSEKIIHTFNQRSNNTGVILSGEQGSGKTLLAKILSIKLGADFGVPTIMVNQPYHGEAFNSFISSIDQPVMVLFDEFEKVYYERKNQNSLLTLFDGIYTSKKMFVLTLNGYSQLTDFVKNRPGRFYYNLEYDYLEHNFVEDYLEDNLVDKSKSKDIMDLYHFIDKFNFDMLQAIVEESNRYKEPIKDILKFLNIEIDSTQEYELVSWEILDETKKKYFLEWCRFTPENNTKIFILDLLSNRARLFYYTVAQDYRPVYRGNKYKVLDEGYVETDSVLLTKDNLVESHNGSFVYEADGFRVTIQKHRESTKRKNIENLTNTLEIDYPVGSGHY